MSLSVHCDPETGLCSIPAHKGTSPETIWKSGEELIYIGDPMCSWCWGISPHLHALQHYARSMSIPFHVVMGGLRPGGGEEWNTDFKSFLRHHWDQVHERSGQPFGDKLFDLAEFDYNTEPACRAVVTARLMDDSLALPFCAHVHHHFYVRSQDPKTVDFYKPVCEALGLDFDRFSHLFSSQEIRNRTVEDFQKSRQWGVSGFPTVVYRRENSMYAIARGYSTFENMVGHLQNHFSEAP